jgi:hypothetical protein
VRQAAQIRSGVVDASTQLRRLLGVDAVRDPGVRQLLGPDA